MRWLRRSCAVAAILGLGFVILALGAVAQDDDGPDTETLVVFNGRTEITAWGSETRSPRDIGMAVRSATMRPRDPLPPLSPPAPRPRFGPLGGPRGGRGGHRAGRPTTQVAILRRQVKRPIYRASDRAFLAAASRILRRDSWSAFLVRLETLLRWHRQLVRRKWTRPHRRHEFLYPTGFSGPISLPAAMAESGS